MKRSAAKRCLWVAIALAAVLMLLAIRPAGAFADEADEDEEEKDERLGTVQDLSVKMYREILEGSDVWFVDFTKDECHACQSIRPILGEWAKEIQAYGIQVGSFGIEQEGGQKIIKDAGLNRVPTLRLLLSPPSRNPYTAKMNRIPVDFPFSEGGSLDIKMLRSFLRKEMPNKVQRITAETYPGALRGAFEEGKNVVLTLTDREKTPTLLKTLALTYGEDFVFLEVPPRETAFLEAFNVELKDLAQLFVLEAKHGAEAFLSESLNSELVASGKYVGDLGAASKVKDFIKKYIAAKPAEDAEEDDEKHPNGAAKRSFGGGRTQKLKDKKKAPPAGGGLPPPPIAELNATNFKEEVLKSKEGWMVWFHQEGGEEGKEGEEWEKYTEKAEGILRCGVVDCAGAAAAGEEATVALCAKEKSVFKAYLYGEEKEEENKGVATVEAAYQEAAASVPDVLKRVGDGSNQYLIENEINGAFRSGRFPVLVFTKKPEPALLFRALALKLEPVLTFLLISDPSKETMARFNSANVPSINVLVPQDIDLYKNGEAAVPAQHNLRIETYLPVFFGPMKFMNVINFFIQVFQRIDTPRAKTILELAIASSLPSSSSSSSSTADSNPTSRGGGPITHISDAASWESACASGGASLCVLGLFGGLPEGESEGGPNQKLLQQVSNLETAALAGGVSPWSFSWVDATCFRRFASDSFDIQEHALPTIVVYSPKKGRFAAFRGRWGVEAVREFLSGILSGRFPTAPVLAAPRVLDEEALGCYLEGGEGGKEGGGVVEEEEDLGDMMAEILAEEKKRKEELAAAVKQDMEAAKAATEAGEGVGEGKKKVVRRKKKKASSDEL